MIQSRPVEIDGHFVGVAVNASADWHFVAIDPALEDLHGMHFSTPDEVSRVARLVVERTGPARRPAPRPA